MKYYTCNYCYNDFEPKRRNAQKYCSATCRSKAYHQRKKSLEAPNTTIKDYTEPTDNVSNDVTNRQTMSLAGVGNATAGSLAADMLKGLLTKGENKPVTKGDLQHLVNTLKGRYHLIKNIPVNNFGEIPHYDIETKMVVYLPNTISK